MVNVPYKGFLPARPSRSVNNMLITFVLPCLQDEMTNALASMRFEPDKVARLKDVGKSSNALLNRRKK